MDDAPMNAKQRRKLLRQQQRGVEEADAVATVATVKSEAPPAVKQEKTQPQTDVEPLNTKERRRLARLAKQQVKQVKQEPKEEETDAEKLNAQQRRLVKRQAKRQVDATEQVAQQKKQKAEKRKRSQEEEEEDGEAVSKRKSIHLTLFVGQIPFRATEQMIRSHFQEAGEIKLRTLTDRRTKRFKGTAFIEVQDSKALGAALSRHHTLLCGRRINVEMTASGGGTKSENRVKKLELLRKKQSNVQVEKTKALIQKHIDSPEYKMKQEDVDERMIDFLSWFDYGTAKKALDEYDRCVGDRVLNRKAFFMGILKRFRQTDGVE